MAVKHIVEYYNIVAKQYNDLLAELRDFEKEAQDGLIEPERLDQIKNNIQPLKNNYMTLSYIMFLLNMPNRDSKQRAYKTRNKKFLQNIPNKNTKEGIIKENNNVLRTFTNKGDNND
jgi:hypothetical protein